MVAGFPDNPRLLMLGAMLAMPRPQAIGTLELLDRFARRYCPEKIISKHPPAVVAEACCFEGEPDYFIKALWSTRWVRRVEKGLRFHSANGSGAARERAERERIAGGRVSAPTRRMVFARDERTCVACGSRDRISIDHIIPLIHGGTNDLDNLQTLCIPCNSSKQDGPEVRRRWQS